MQNQVEKNIRRLKVYGKYRQKARTAVIEPEIRLKGVWLKKLGFTPGQSVQVIQEQSQLTIKLIRNA